MGESSLIVAHLAAGAEAPVARLFTESDAGELPVVLGVRQRQLFRYRDLYFHYVEFAGDRREALDRAAQHSEFRKISAALARYVTPYDPDTWRSPADALAECFYSWSASPEPDPL